MADNYDFTIDNLKFRLATSDKFPYVRGTAPFRKEQFDSARTPGDQSLSGWWVRGQLSFHRGEGLNYYEVLEDEVVLNRYKDSVGVRVFEPGEVELDYANSTATIQNVIHWQPNASNSNLFLLSNGDVYRGGVHDATIRTLVGTSVTATAIAGSVNTTYWWAATSDDNIQRFFGSAAGSIIYTHSTAIYSIWYGKERLWVIDADGAVYAVATNQSPSVALSSPICTLDGWDSALNSSWAETGGAVFLANGSQVWAFTVESDGSVATMTSAITVAKLPQGETIDSMAEHMGLLVMATESGCRVATYDGTTINIGAPSIAWYGTKCNNIVAQGSSVFVTGYTRDSANYVSRGYQIDLTDPLEPGSLRYPHRTVHRESNPIASGVPFSGAMWRDGSSPQPNWYFGADTLYQNFSSNRVSSGELYTAEHRLGTLDPKHWHSVTVWAAGSAGTIAVYQVESDETETLLGTLDVSVADRATYSFTLSPAPSVALKFVLTGSTSLSPKLLGYQIKALPMPERQRLIQVPLQVTDFITLKNGTRVGTEGRAFSDMAALEALEESGVVVAFTDHRTGETGTAYVDSVQFQGETPTTFNDNGFGGFAYVTLRVID